MSNPDKKTLIAQQKRVADLLVKAEGYELFLNSDRAHVVVTYPPPEPMMGDCQTMYQKPRRDIHVGGRPIEHHHFELRDLIKELRLELETVNKMSNITVEEARRRLLIDLQEMTCLKSTSTGAKSL
jgi:hypothetical protein